MNPHKTEEDLFHHHDLGPPTGITVQSQPSIHHHHHNSEVDPAFSLPEFVLFRSSPSGDSPGHSSDEHDDASHPRGGASKIAASSNSRVSSEGRDGVFISPDPHISSQFYTFNADSHSLMIRVSARAVSLLRRRSVSLRRESRTKSKRSSDGWVVLALISIEKLRREKRLKDKDMVTIERILSVQDYEQASEESLAPRHVDTKFIKVDAENAPFFVTKLAIKTLPCVVLFSKGIAMDRLVYSFVSVWLHNVPWGAENTLAAPDAKVSSSENEAYDLIRTAFMATEGNQPSQQ